MTALKRYAFPLCVLGLALVLAFVYPDKQQAIITGLGTNAKEFLTLLPPIFVLMGLADVYIPRETVVRYMGKGSLVLGVFLAVAFGAFAAGPLYAAFPVASMLLRKGASFVNVMIFIGAWSTLKVPMFLFETASLGSVFSVTRWVSSLVMVTAIALALNAITSSKEKEEILEKQPDSPGSPLVERRKTI